LFLRKSHQKARSILLVRVKKPAQRSYIGAGNGRRDELAIIDPSGANSKIVGPAVADEPFALAAGSLAEAGMRSIS
jgi:hypothetical protein